MYRIIKIGKRYIKFKKIKYLNGIRKLIIENKDIKLRVIRKLNLDKIITYR